MQSLPDFAPKRQKSRVGEQQPVRASGGRTPRQWEYGELSFFWDSRGASVSTNPSDRSGETEVAGVRSREIGDNSGRTRHLFPSHAAAHDTCEQRPSVDQARDNLDHEVARSAVYAPRSFGMQERTSSQPPALGHKPFPMAFGDNFDDAINHLYSGLIVNTRIKLVAFTTIILVGKRLVRPCPPG